MDIDRGKDDGGRRWYVESMALPDDDSLVSADDPTDPTEFGGLSVTTILGYLDEDTTGLERWQDRNDGEGDSMHHEHIFWYSGPRGTLCHYDALNPLADRELWGSEEASSAEAIISGPSADNFDDASPDNRDVAYSLLVNHGVLDDLDQFDALFPNVSLSTILERDRNWFLEQFRDAMSRLYVSESDVIAVEQFLLAEADGFPFGGQADLVYRDPNDNVVMADLKTSSSLRHKHRLQTVAYANAIEQAKRLPDTVDRCEVWRFCPDDESVDIHAEYEPASDATDLTTSDNWFDDEWGEFSYDDRAEMWDTFCRLAEKAYDDASDVQLDDIELNDE